MDNKFIGLMVGLTVGVLMVSGFLWPIVSDATKTTEKIENEGYFTLDAVSEAHTLTWDYTAPKSVTVDDSVIDLSALDYTRAYTVFGGNSFMLRATGGGIQAFLPAGSNPLFLQATVAAQTNMTVNIAADSATFTVGSDSVSVNFNVAYLINTAGNGSYTMKFADETASILDNSEIILVGVSRTFSANDLGVYAIGSLSEDFEFTFFRGNTPAVSQTGEVTINTVDNEKYKSVSEISNVQFTVTQNEVEYDLTYSYFLVPTELTAELAQHLDTTQIALVAAIGTLGAIVLIAAAAGSIRRLD